MKLVGYCGDVGGERLIQTYFEAVRGHGTVLVPSGAKGKVFEHIGQFESADRVWLVPSAFVQKGHLYREENELANHLVERGIAVWWIEDVPVARDRIEDRRAIRGAEGIILSIPQGYEEVQKRGFKRSHYLGAPATWRSTYDTLMATPSANGLLKQVGALVAPVTETDIVISFLGIKDHVLCNEVLRLAVEIGTKLTHSHAVVAFRAHPTESSDPVAENERLDILQSCPGGYIFIKPQRNPATGKFDQYVSFPQGQDVSSPALMRVAKVVLSTGMPTDSHAAVLARLPIAYYTNEHNEARNAGQGSRTWPFAEWGGLHKIHGSADFERGLAYLLSEHGRRELRDIQRHEFPRPEWADPAKVVEIIAS